MKLTLFLILILLPALSFAEATVESYGSWEEARLARKLLVSHKKFTRTQKLPALNFSENIEKYNRITKLIDKVALAYKALYPEQVSRFKVNPWPILIEESSLGGHAFLTPDITRNIIIIQTGSLKHNDEVITGLIAHELAHLYLQTKKGEYSETFPVTRYYQGSKIFEKDIELNLDLEEKLKRWNFYAMFAGSSTNSIFNHISLNLAEEHANFLNIILNLVERNGSKQQCKDFSIDFSNFDEFIIPYFRNSSVHYHTRPFHQQLQDLSTSVTDKMKSCLNFKINIYKEYGLVYNIHEDLMRIKFVNDMDIAKYREDYLFQVFTYFSELNAGEAFARSIKLAKKPMIKIEEQLKFDRLRKYTNEDHADEVAVRVLNHMKVSYEPLFNEISNVKKYLQNTCDGLPKEEPVYGLIKNNHHTPCWRYWRAGKVHEAINKK